MAAALLHEPEILFLDEPTSGADPLARREFWQRITDLAEHGVTVIVTTHFMEEAEYCDRVVILDAGHVLAQGTPAEIRSHAQPEPGKPATMEDAFIAIVEECAEGREEEASERARRVARECKFRTGTRDRPAPLVPLARSPLVLAKLRRIWTLVRKEYRQIVRDPSSIADRRRDAGVADCALRLWAVARCEECAGGDRAGKTVARCPGAGGPVSAFALFRCPAVHVHEGSRGPDAGPASGRHCPDPLGLCQERGLERRGGANPRTRHRRQPGPHHPGLCPGAVGQWTARRLAEGQAVVAGPVGLRDRLWFNEANDSHYFLVPGLVVLVMTLIGAMLTSLVMAREWERGTLEALFVTPVQADEILLGKTIPYFVLGMFGLALCLLAGKFLFHVPFRGSVVVLAGVSMLYLLVALGIGLFISSATKNQFVAIQLTMLVTFLPAMMLSGFLFDLRNMPAAVRLITYVLPARYYVGLLQTIFLAGNVWSVIVPNARGAGRDGGPADAAVLPGQRKRN